MDCMVQMEAIMCLPQIVMSKDEWDMKECTGKFMKNALQYELYSVMNVQHKKRNFLEGCNLKTFLTMAMPNQYCQTVVKGMWGWFWGDIFVQ